MRSKIIKYQSSEIFYRIIGKGKTVVLLHGFGEDGDIWNEQIAFLKDHFHLIVPDLPGSGQSQLIPDMSVEGMAELIKEILNIELQFPLQGAEGAGAGAKGVYLLGHSLGGYITLAFAQKYPERLHAFGLVHSTAYADSEEKKIARRKSIGFIKKNGAYEFLKASIPGLFRCQDGRCQDGRCQDGSKPSDTYINNLIEKGKNFTTEALVQYYEAMIARPDRTDVLRNSTVPVLFIIGEYDTTVPFQQSLQQCYLPHRSYVHILRNSAHMGMLEETGKVNEMIKTFLDLVL